MDPAGEFMSQAIGIDNVAVSFDGDDFSEDLFSGDRFIRGSRSISAKNKTKRCQQGGKFFGPAIPDHTLDTMGDKIAVGPVQDDISLVDIQRLYRLYHESFIGQYRWIHAMAGSAKTHLVAVS